MRVIGSNRWRSLLLGTTGVVFALVLMETPVLLNLFDYRNVVEGWISYKSWDPELWVTHRPHSRLRGAERGGLFAQVIRIPSSDMRVYEWDLKYDHNGFRNAVDLRRADIVVTGSSFVEEMMIPDGQLLTTILAQLQNAVVANLGGSGYGPQQQLVALKRYGLPLEPRTVVWAFADFTDLRQALVVYYSQAHGQSSYFRTFFQRSFTRSAYITLRNVAQKTIADLKDICDSAQRSTASRRYGIIQNSSGGVVKMYFLHPAHSFNGEDALALEEARRVLADAYRRCIAQGARLVIVFIPTQYRVFHTFARFPEESECRKWVLDDMPDRLGRTVESISSKIGYLDLTPTLVDAVEHGTIPYLTDDNHWSPEGHRIAAQAISKYLSEMDHPR